MSLSEPSLQVDTGQESLVTDELVWAIITGGHWTLVPHYRWACLSRHYRWTLDRSPSLQVGLSAPSLQVDTGQESLVTGELVWAVITGEHWTGVPHYRWACLSHCHETFRIYVFLGSCRKVIGPKNQISEQKKAKKDFLHCLANVGECW